MQKAQLFALLLGVLAVAAGAGGIANAVLTLRRRSALGPTYGNLGGPLYTGAQAGCGAALLLLGLVIVGAVLLLHR